MAADPFIIANLVTQGIALTGGRRESDIRQMVKRQLILASEFYVSEVKLKTPVGATNYLRDSWDYGYSDQEQTSTIAPRAEYAIPVELGRKAAPVPIEPLTLWVRRKLGVSDAKQARGIAFAISRKKRTTPTPGQNFASETFAAVLPAINSNFIAPIGALVVRALGG